jgi:hypothetical protein
MKSAKKVAESGTALVGAGAALVAALSSRYGWNIPPELLGAIVVAYGVKEHGKVARGPRAPPKR